MGNDRLTNGLPPSIPNGPLRSSHSESNRAIHDGFATIRSGSGKRGRTRSSPSVATDAKPKPCPACCSPGATGTAMEPLWEERNGGTANSDIQNVVRRDPKIPWWELATRRSRYRSCPAFSQANIMSALEQTVSDVTDRLERLASSPDLKESEAEELRKSASVLRRQSSAVSQSVSSGYFSLERQASCDSVSSVSSSVSNATHISAISSGPRINASNQHCFNDHNHNHNVIQSAEIPAEEHAKNKKGSWLRASFRRAFGKQTRKRHKLREMSSGSAYDPITIGGQPPLASTSLRDSIACGHYFSCNSLHRNRHQCPPSSFADMCKEHRSRMSHNNAIRAESEDRLQILLQEKEKALVECRAELLTAQLQAQKQNELVAKLQVESAALKEENSRLLSLVENKFGSLPESSLNPTIKNVDSLNINNSAGAYATLHKKGKRITVLIVENTSLADASDAASFTASNDLQSLLAGSVSVSPKTTWEELDNTIAESFEDYCSRFDPGSGLGLGRESLLCYKLAEAVRGEGLSKPDLLPYGYCVGKVDSIYLWLKGPLQKETDNPHGNISSIAFQNGIPAPTMKSLTNLLHETRRIMIVGPSATGKTTLAKQLAKAYVASKGLKLNEKSISFFTVTGSNSLELCRLLSGLWPHGRATLLSHKVNSEDSSQNSSITPEVLVIDDIHAASGVVETLQRCLPLSTQTNPVIIATSSNSPSLVTRLQVHCYFRWVGLSVQEEPVKGLLGRILRRPLLAAENTSGISLPMVHRTVDWLSRLSMHLNSLISSSGADICLGPTLLSDCPLDQEEARKWFTWKWNEFLAPKFKEILKNGINNNWVDPKEWVVATYPWTGDASALSQLASIKAEKEVKVPASPSFRIAFPHRQALSTAVKPQIKATTTETLHSIFNSPNLLPKAENLTTAPTYKKPPCPDETATQQDSVKSTPTIGNFSTFLKTSIGNISTTQSYTPILYRRDYVNKDIDMLIMANEGKIVSDKSVKQGKEENRKYSMLHTGLIK